jgi:hypothetical protein
VGKTSRISDKLSSKTNTADAQTLADSDRRADERFLMLDALEAQDAQAKRRWGLAGGPGADRQGAALPHSERLPR